MKIRQDYRIGVTKDGFGLYAVLIKETGRASWTPRIQSLFTSTYGREIEKVYAPELITQASLSGLYHALYTGAFKLHGEWRLSVTPFGAFLGHGTLDLGDNRFPPYIQMYREDNKLYVPTGAAIIELEFPEMMFWKAVGFVKEKDDE